MFPEDKIIEIFSICDDFSKVFDKGKIPSEAATVYLKNTDFYISPQVVPIRVKSTDRQHKAGDVDLWLRHFHPSKSASEMLIATCYHIISHRSNRSKQINTTALCKSVYKSPFLV